MTDVLQVLLAAIIARNGGSMVINRTEVNKLCFNGIYIEQLEDGNYRLTVDQRDGNIH